MLSVHDINRIATDFACEFRVLIKASDHVLGRQLPFDYGHRRVTSLVIDN